VTEQSMWLRHFNRFSEAV